MPNVEVERLQALKVMKYRPTRKLLILCVTLILAGCGNSELNPIVGEWEGITNGQFGRVQNDVVFGSDGNYFWNYDFPDLDRVVKENFYLKFALIATEVSGKYRVTGNELIISPLTRKNTLGGEEKELPPSVTDFEFVYPYEFEGEFLVMIDENGREIRLSKKRGFFGQWFD